MARLRSNPDFDIFHDGGGAPSPSRSSDTNTDTDTDTATAALRSLPTNQAQNFLRVLEPSPSSPAADLEKVHIQTPKKADPEGILKNRPVGGCHQSRTPIRSHTFVSPHKNSERKHAHFDLPTTPTATTPAEEQITEVDLPGEQAGDQTHILRVSDPFAKEQLAKHRAATPIDGDDGLLTEQTAPVEEEQAMANPAHGGTPSTPSQPSGPHLGPSSVDPTRVSPKSLLNGGEGRLSAHHTPARSPGTPSLRIEDSFEELDRLEDQFEAVDTIVQVKRVPSPDKMAPATGAGRPALKRTTSTSRQPGANARPVRPKAAEMSHSGSARKSASRASGSQDDDGEGAKPTPPKKAPAVVPRPASLLPPKPLARSSKTPTMPTFELPGEAVARRLKEQREARMAGLVSAADAPRPPSPQKIRSNKVPTRPTFELPGEAISRRKREEHAARLRAQEEEERRRREFKARPVRNSIAPGSYPRETISSRARQTKAAAPVEGGGEGPSVPGSASKRHSLMPRTTLAVGGGGGHAQSRGRGSTVGSTQASRAASSSTGSTSGKHSTVSAEDVQHQKQRGKEVYSRDNSITMDRERERRDREAAAKIARQEAAERSRMLSREWAEKQKQRLKKATPPESPSGPANVVVR